MREYYRLRLTGIVAAGKVIGSILLARDELFGVEQLPVGTSPHFIDYGGLQIKEHASRDVLASTGLRKEGVESIVASPDGLVRGHLHNEKPDVSYQLRRGTAALGTVDQLFRSDKPLT